MHEGCHRRRERSKRRWNMIMITINITKNWNCSEFKTISRLSQNCLTKIVTIFRIGSDTEFGIPWNSVNCIICSEKNTFNLSCFSKCYLRACIQWCVKWYICGNFCFFPFTRTPFEHELFCCQAAYFPQLYQFLQSQRNLSTPSRSKRLSWLAGRSSWSVLQNTEEKTAALLPKYYW